MADNLGPIGSASISIEADLKSFRQSVASQSAELQRILGQAGASIGSAFKLEGLAQNLQGLGSVATRVGLSLTASLTAPIAAVTALGISFNSTFEQARIGFTTMLGSATKAQTFLESMKDFAARTPFEFPELVQASQRMLAYGISAEKILPTLKAVGNAASLLGGGAESINRITLAIGQISAKGAASAEEFRQLAEAGIPAWDILAKKLGVTIPEAMKQVEARSVSASVAIDALTEGMNTRFANGMEKAAHSWAGLMSTIADESRFLAGALTSGLFDAIKGPLESFTNGLSEVRKTVEGLPGPVKAAIAAFALLVAAIGPVTLGFGILASGIASMITNVPLAIAGITSLAGHVTTTVIPALVKLAEWLATVTAGEGLMAIASTALAGVLTVTAAAVTGLSSAFAILAANPLIFALGALAYELVRLKIAVDDLHKAEDERDRALDREAASAVKAAETMRAHGFAIQTAGLSTKELEQAITRALPAYRKWIDSQVSVNAELKRYNDAVQKLSQPILDRPQDMKDLAGAIQNLLDHSVKYTEVVARLGQASVEAATASRLYGGALDPLVAKLAADFKATEAATKAKEDLAEKTKAASKAITDGIAREKAAFEDALHPVDALNTKLEHLITPTTDLHQLMAVEADEIIRVSNAQRANGEAVTGLTAALEPYANEWVSIHTAIKDTASELQNFPSAIRMPLPQLMAPMPEILPPPPTVTEGTIAAMKAYEQARTRATELSTTIDELSHTLDANGNRAYSDAQIQVLLSSELDAAAKSSKELGIPLASNVRIFLEHQRAVDASSEAAKRWSDIWARATKKLEDDFSRAVTNVIFRTGKFSDDVKKIFKDLAESIVKSLVDNAFSKIIKGFSDMLGGFLSKQGGFLGALGSVISPSIFKSAAPSVASAAIPASADFGAAGIAATAGGVAAPATGLAAALGPAGSAGSIGVLGLSGAATLGIGAAVVGAALLVKHFVGEGRKTANKFTQGSQAEFDRNLGNVVDEFNIAKNNGTLTLDKATALRETLGTVLSDITDSANEFGKGGKNEQKVVKQFFDQQDQIFGRNWSNLTAEFDTTIKELSDKAKVDADAAKTETAVPGSGIPQTGLAISASRIFSDAVDKMSESFDRVAQAFSPENLQRFFSAIAPGFTPAMVTGDLPSLATGGTILGTGAAILHTGELVGPLRTLESLALSYAQGHQPATSQADLFSALFFARGSGLDTAGSGGPTTVNQTFNLNFEITGTADLSPQAIRDQVLPEILDVMQTGVRGFRASFTNIILGAT